MVLMVEPGGGQKRKGENAGDLLCATSELYDLLLHLYLSAPYLFLFLFKPTCHRSTIRKEREDAHSAREGAFHFPEEKQRQTIERSCDLAVPETNVP